MEGTAILICGARGSEFVSFEFQETRQINIASEKLSAARHMCFGAFGSTDLDYSALR